MQSEVNFVTKDYVVFLLSVSAKTLALKALLLLSPYLYHINVLSAVFHLFPVSPVNIYYLNMFVFLSSQQLKIIDLLFKAHLSLSKTNTP